MAYVCRTDEGVIKGFLYIKTEDQSENYSSIEPSFILFDKQKFILPIMAKYHTSLLPDSILKTEKQIDFMGKDAQKYALQKVYISWSPERNINPGDLVLFYRMGEDGSNKKYTSVLTTLGMVDRIHYGFNNKEDFLKQCQNRSVFSKDDLDYFWNRHRANLMVLKFVFVKSLKKRLTLDYLHQLGVVEPPNGPRPFMRISDEVFKQILSDSNTNVKFVDG